MATGPELSVVVRDVPVTTKVEIHNPAQGQKLPWYRAAVRRGRDRDYVPTDVWNELG